MTQNEAELPTPREFDYWKLTYRELTLLPEWLDLGAEARAVKLLEKIEAEIAEADAPPQRKALFNCPGEGRLKTVRRMIKYFEEEDRS